MFSLKIVEKFKNSAIISFWNRCNRHDIIGMSAKISYYMIISIFPLAIILLPILSKLDMRMFEYIIPSSVIAILTSATSSTPPKDQLTILSILLILWSSTSSIWALMKGISVIHDRINSFKNKKG